MTNTTGLNVRYGEREHIIFVSNTAGSSKVKGESLELGSVLTLLWSYIAGNVVNAFTMMFTKFPCCTFITEFSYQRYSSYLLQQLQYWWYLTTRLLFSLHPFNVFFCQFDGRVIRGKNVFRPDQPFDLGASSLP